VKLLLTSAGIKNASIRSALVDMLDKPIAECSALCIPTASYANPNGPSSAWNFVSGQCCWMKQSGLADLLPSLRDTVYVGLSAGSMVMAPRIGEWFVGWRPPEGGDETLGLVDFAMFPHLDHEDLPYNSMAHAERWAADMTVPAYAMDDETAVKVIDGAVEVVSEGHWKRFAP